jgi:hypothetical protein
MALLDLLEKSPQQVLDKQVQQLIAFAGAGKLTDDSVCSAEFRAFLARVPSERLRSYADQCLAQPFPDSGLALQDVVNEVGARLGSSVSSGRYRGTVKHVGFDGLWKFSSDHWIVTEVKTTDAYRIDLNTIADYRTALVDNGIIPGKGTSSILLIVGRHDTGDLEAQIRGSRHAWDIRIISVDALFRLLAIKEAVEDPQIIQRIHSILVPREFTRLDEIVDVLFSTTEDIKQDDTDELPEEQPAEKRSKEPKFVPVAFHDACISRIQERLGTPLIKRTRAQFTNHDKTLMVNCLVSREHSPDTSPNYWFAFHPHQREALRGTERAYIAFGCGGIERILLIPFHDFDQWVDGMWMTETEDRMYWHVVIYRKGEEYSLHRRKGEVVVDLSKYLMAN